jgi:hypothetical protein
MIVFIDLSNKIEGYQPKICAFLNTTSNQFLTSLDNQHLFQDLEAVQEHQHSERMLRLLPENFFQE